MLLSWNRSKTGLVFEWSNFVASVCLFHWQKCGLTPRWARYRLQTMKYKVLRDNIFAPYWWVQRINLLLPLWSKNEEITIIIYQKRSLSLKNCYIVMSRNQIRMLYSAKKAYLISWIDFGSRQSLDYYCPRLIFGSQKTILQNFGTRKQTIFFLVIADLLTIFMVQYFLSEMMTMWCTPKTMELNTNWHKT